MKERCCIVNRGTIGLLLEPLDFNEVASLGEWTKWMGHHPSGSCGNSIVEDKTKTVRSLSKCSILTGKRWFHREKMPFLELNFTQIVVFWSIRYPTDSWIDIRRTDTFKYPGYPLSWISVLETLVLTKCEKRKNLLSLKKYFVKSILK